MRLLTAFDAIVARRLVDAYVPTLRQDDSVDGTLLPDAAESEIVRAMTNAPTELPDDIDALKALVLAAREAHAAALAERNTIAVERDLLSVRTEKLEQTLENDFLEGALCNAGLLTVRR
jgi:hypothetical protein